MKPDFDPVIDWCDRHGRQATAGCYNSVFELVFCQLERRLAVRMEPSPDMVEAGWEVLLAADWENLSPGDVEDVLIAALQTRLP